VVLNADSPTLPTSLLVRAAQALAAADDRIVLGPAEDGGYYLLGMNAAHAHLFADIAWSTDTVAETTRMRAATLGLPLLELPVWYDVDDPATLHRLAQEAFCPGQHASDLPPYAAPFTVRALAALGWPLRGVEQAAQ
jgi:glycosyltransferase A (GT-A) superfamily protein (DUF2064 family)